MLTAQSSNLHLRMGQIQAQQQGGCTDARIGSHLPEHFEAKHHSVELNVAWIYFHEELGAVPNAVGVDVGDVEDRRQNRFGLNHVVDGKPCEFAQYSACVAQRCHLARIERFHGKTRGPDGMFHLVWTTGWWDKGIGTPAVECERIRLPVARGMCNGYRANLHIS